MSDVSIRPAAPADIPAITRIYAHAVEHGTASFELEPPDEAEMARRMQALLTNELSLPRRRDAPARSSATPMRGPTARGRPIDWSVEDSVYVAPDSQRRGIGAALLRELVDRRRQARGFRQMIAVIGDSAQTASIALHRRGGLSPCRRSAHRSASSSAAGSTRVLMQRALGSGDTTTP